MNLRSLIPAVAVIAAAASTAFARPVDLVKEGKSEYSICLARDASPSEKRAAAELQRFLEEMSGARLPIGDCTAATGGMVFVGRSAALDRLRPGVPFEQLGPEGYVLKTSGPHVIIAGGRLRGTMYGVYGFLEKLGCRWFTREVSRIPKKRNIRIEDLDETQKPAFEYREPYFTEAFDGDWAARNRANGAFMKLDPSMGGKVVYYPFVHSFYHMLPPEKYFKDHPEYYSFIDGKRRADRGQLCLTNPEVLRLSVDVVREWIRQHPDATIFSVSQNDWTGWCECDNCRRAEQEEGGEHSGPLLRFVNQIAEQIGKEHPDKLIDTLAYWYTENPPLKVRPRPNVRIRLCPIGVCEAHPYEACTRSAYFMKNLRAWSEITNQLYIWHYNTNFTHYMSPFPDFDELAADIPMYRKHGVVGVFLEGAYPPGGGAENAELRSYIMARLLWDPRANVQEGIREFTDAVYGKAAPFIREYLDLMHREVRTPPQGLGMHLWIFNVPRFSTGFTAEARRLFAQAEGAAENDVIRSRVRQARLPVEYIEYLRAHEFSVRGGVYAPADLTVLTERFRSFYAALRGFSISSIREGVDLDVMEKEFADNIKPYPVVTAENAAVRVDVVPGLNGRIIRMTDPGSGRDALARVDPGDRGYPNLAGWVVSAYTDYHARSGMPCTWTVDPVEQAGRISLTGTLGRGLILNRTLELAPDGTVRTVATVRNTGQEPVDVALQVRVDLDPGEPDRSVFEWKQRDGKDVALNFVQPEREPTGNENYLGEDQPDGECRLTTAGRERTTTFRFNATQVARTFVNWTAKGIPRATIGLWSPQVHLAPTQSLTLESSCK
jgi:hypothetical protein